MKTLIVYELVPEETRFFLVEGDKTYLNGCFINTVGDKEFTAEVKDEVSAADTWGEPLKTPISITEPLWSVVHCGFIL